MEVNGPHSNCKYCKTVITNVAVRAEWASMTSVTASLWYFVITFLISQCAEMEHGSTVSFIVRRGPDRQSQRASSAG